MHYYTTVLHHGQLPLEWPEFGETAKVALVRRDHRDSQPSCAHRDQGVVGQASTADLFVMVLSREAGEYPSAFSPVSEVGNEDTIRVVKVPL